MPVSLTLTAAHLADSIGQARRLIATDIDDTHQVLDDLSSDLDAHTAAIDAHPSGGASAALLLLAAPPGDPEARVKALALLGLVG